jgi:DNA-binding SARP family transcriptional activator
MKQAICVETTAPTKTASPLAKLSRPRLFGALSRERLFTALDQHRAHPLVWVCGPPGAGKTTLVASYVEARQLPGIWYRVDSGDGDPATFFHYLSVAACTEAAGEQEPMPLLAPEFLADPSGFSRRFFRELFGRLPRPGVLVLDDSQEVLNETAFHALLVDSASEIPEGLNVILISRGEPPSMYTRLLANRTLALLDSDDLRLTAEEARAIASALSSDEALLDTLYRQSGGWAAGLTLMLESLRRSGIAPEGVEAQTREAVFNYFAGEILDRATPEDKHVLVSTAFLPRMTAAMAEQLSQSPGASQLLHQLYRGQLFTNCCPGSPPTYQYHDLFRQFLLARAEQMYPSDQLQQIAGRAAALLVQQGELEHAVALYARSEDWTATIDLILKQGGQLLAQGRAQTLREWIDLLPEQQIVGTPWLAYWHAMALMVVDRRDAHAELERAWDGFRDTSDESGQLLTAAAKVEMFQRNAEIAGVARWLDVLDELLNRNTSVPDCELLRAFVALRRQDRIACHRFLTEVFTSASFVCAASQPFVLYPHLMAQLCAEALREQIAVEQVKALIKQYRLCPPSLHEEAWPWPIKVYTLGHFNVLKDGAPIRFARRTQKKPLELLQALIAFGGIEVAVNTLSEALWPDAEGDTAYHAFESVLYRLRQLLGSPGALTLAGGKLSLDRRSCWVDVWALERQLSVARSDDANPEVSFEQLKHLYRGHFLMQESEKFWALATRERLREKFLLRIQTIAAEHEAAQRWEEAAAIYQRGIELDNLAERLYRGLMVCHRALGNHAEAFQTYRRCRELLSVVLGVQPTAQTQAVYESLKHDSMECKTQGEVKVVYAREAVEKTPHGPRHHAFGAAPTKAVVAKAA